jgi:hypothetical protein
LIKYFAIHPLVANGFPGHGVQGSGGKQADKLGGPEGQEVYSPALTLMVCPVM